MNDVDTTQFRAEGDPAFPTANTEKDNSADSSSGEQNNTDQTQSQGGEQNQAQGGDTNKAGGESGFQDHPRWKERETDWTNRFNEQEKRHVDEIGKLREEFLGKGKAETEVKTEVQANTAPEKAPEWFGGDDEAWNLYRGHTEKLVNQAVELALSKVSEKSESEKKAVDEATKFFNDEVGFLESDKTINPSGTKVDRNRLLKTAMDFDLVDSKGRWNYRAAFAFLKNTAGGAPKTNNLEDKKELAGATTSENRAETKPSDVTTSDDFRKPGARPW